MNKITSKQNEKIKFLKKLRDNSNFRKEQHTCFLEGETLINDTPIDLINEVFISEKYKGKLPGNLNIDSKNVFVLDDNIFNLIIDTVNSSGICATCKILHKNLEECILKNNNFILFLNGISDPGNMGTIIRTAESAGVSLIIVDKNCVDIYSPKVVRSSMSSLCRINICKIDDIINTIDLLHSKNIKIYVTSLKSSVSHFQIAYDNNICIVIGSESRGVSEAILKRSDHNIKIEMLGSIESLNAGVATGIILFEIKRRREVIKND